MSNLPFDPEGELPTRRSFAITHPGAGRSQKSEAGREEKLRGRL